MKSRYIKFSQTNQISQFLKNFSVFCETAFNALFYLLYCPCTYFECVVLKQTGVKETKGEILSVCEVLSLMNPTSYYMTTLKN